MSVLAPEILANRIREISPIEVSFSDVDDTMFPLDRPANLIACKIANQCLEAHGKPGTLDPEAWVKEWSSIAFSHSLPTMMQREGVQISMEEASKWDIEQLEAVIKHIEANGVDHAPGVIEATNNLVRLDKSLLAISSSNERRLNACFDSSPLGKIYTPDLRISGESHHPDGIPHPKPSPWCYEEGKARFPGTKVITHEDSLAGVSSSLDASVPVIGYLGLLERCRWRERIEAMKAKGVDIFLPDWHQHPELMDLLERGDENSILKIIRRFSADAVISQI